MQIKKVEEILIMNDCLKPVPSSLKGLFTVTDNFPPVINAFTSSDKCLQFYFNSSLNIDLDNFKCTALVVA